MIKLISYEDLQDLLGISGGEIQDYPALGLLRDSVAMALEEFTGREFEQIERTEEIIISSVPVKMIYLSAIPISSVSSVTDEDGNAVSYRKQKYGISLDGSISDNILTVVYTGGFTENSVPNGIKRAALIQTAYEYQSKNHIASETVSTEGGTVSRPALQLLPMVRRLLTKHIHPLKWSA